MISNYFNLHPPYKNIIFIFLYYIMSTGNEEILEVKVDKSVKSRHDLFVKLLKANGEFVNFVKNYSDTKDRESLVEVIKQLKNLKTSKSRSKTAGIHKSKIPNSKTRRRTTAIKGGIGRDSLMRYIRMGLYFIYCAVIAFGLYQGSDMIIVGVNQVSSGTCFSWTNRLTSHFGTRHPFCDIWWNMTDTLVRALSGFEPTALGTVAVSTATPVVAVYIQIRAINGLASAITDRILGAQQGSIQYPSGPILINDTRVIDLPRPTAAVLPSASASPRASMRLNGIEPISSDEGSPSPDARTHPSRRNNMSRSRRSRSRSPSGGRRKRTKRSRRKRA